MLQHTFLTIQQIQWNLSNQDTNGGEESVSFSEVSLLQCQSGRVGKAILCPQFKGVLIEVFHCILIKEHLLQLIIGTSEWTIGSDGQFGKPSN